MEGIRLMYRILQPNGHWIIDDQWPEHLRFKDLEAAVKYAKRIAKITGDYGEFLVYEGASDTPSANFKFFSSEDDE